MNPPHEPIASSDIPRLLANLKVEQPVAEDSNLYVDLSEVRGGSPSLFLFNTVQYAEPGRFTHQLITGFPGSGKSTELLALKKRLTDAGYFPVYLDVDSFISKSRALEPNDILLAIGAALRRKPGHILV